jgi:AAHS family 4-hydroxybenzoate transporter-like MFS transporter
MVGVMLIGFITGAIAVGLFAAELVPALGWRSIFILDGVLPLLLLPVLFAALPESLRFLVVRERPRDMIARIVRRIDPAIVVDSNTRLVVEEAHASGTSVAALFRDGRGAATVLLWTIYFLSLLNLYLFANWLTVHMTSAGIPLERAIFIHSLFQVGGVFGAVFGWVFDKSGPSRAIFLAYLIGGVAIACIGLVGSNVPLLIVSVLAAGFGIIGGQTCANALAAISYPTQIRSTGVGWATGVGRAGSILGPGLAGILVQWGMSTQNIFYLAVIPAVCAALAGAALGGLRRPVALKEGAAGVRL